MNIPNYKVTFTSWRKGSPEELSENEVDQTTEPPVGEFLESNINIPRCSSLETTIYELLLLDDEVVTTTSIPFGVPIGSGILLKYCFSSDSWSQINIHI